MFVSLVKLEKPRAESKNMSPMDIASQIIKCSVQEINACQLPV
jgi:hypothetical protein